MAWDVQTSPPTFLMRRLIHVPYKLAFVYWRIGDNAICGQCELQASVGSTDHRVLGGQLTLSPFPGPCEMREFLLILHFEGGLGGHETEALRGRANCVCSLAE